MDFVLRLAVLALAACTLRAEIDFATSIHPILASRCVPCHSGAKPAAGLDYTKRESVLKVKDILIAKVSGERGGIMPPSGDPLTAAQIATLKQWIDEGVHWTDTEPAAAASWAAPLAPRTPKLPESKYSNPIDRFVDVYLDGKMPEPVGDALFARRVYYDLWGLPPTPEQLREFVNDTKSDKREKLISALLANSSIYAGNWISFWNDLLRNDQGVIYHGERESITPWLKRALETNQPYNRMVAALVNPVATDDPRGFLIGVNWRGDVNASQTPYMQASQNTAQIFLGVNLKCASCHDSFINRYRLKQSYGMAALFSETPSLELVRCDLKTGVRTGPEFLYPELGQISEDATLRERHVAAERFFTTPENGRVSRTIVNRYWRKLFGRGLTEPVDEMDNQPWNADLLDWLASDFAANGYDLKYLLQVMMTSRAYQMPTVEPANSTRLQAYKFQGPLPRRLTAEQFVDTISALTGEWRVYRPDDNDAGATYAREWMLKATPLSRAMGRPIRDQVFTTRLDEATTLQALELVNGETLAMTLRRGAMRLAGELPPPPKSLFDSGLRKNAKSVDIDIRGAKSLWLIAEDAGSYDPARTIAAWLDMEVVGPSGAKKLADLATPSKLVPRELKVQGTAEQHALAAEFSKPLVFSIEGLGYTRLRGRIAVDDSSTADDVGASVRFFVFAEQPDRQQMVAVTGDPPVPLPVPAKSQLELIDRLFLQTLARTPSDAERQVAQKILGKGGVSGTEDLLWSLLLQPEMQYIN
jgi:hypothetical protein